MSAFAKIAALTIGLAALGSVAFLACDDSSNAVKEPSPDASTSSSSGNASSSSGSSGTSSGSADGGGDAGPSDCFVNPKTHYEIINACTNATKITKNPVLPRLFPDGGLPPLN